MQTLRFGYETINAHNDAKDGDLLLLRSRLKKIPLLGIWTSDDHEQFFTVLRAEGERDLVLPQRLPTLDLDNSGLGLKITGVIVPRLEIDKVRFDSLRASASDRLGTLSVHKDGSILSVARDATGAEVIGINVETGHVQNSASTAMGFPHWSIVCKDMNGQFVSIFDFEARTAVA